MTSWSRGTWPGWSRHPACSTGCRSLGRWTRRGSSWRTLAATRCTPRFILAIALGLRRGEIAGLHWGDIDLDNRTLTVRHQFQRLDGELYEDSRKSRRTRVIPLPAMCVPPLRWQRMRQVEQQRTASGKWEASDYGFTTRTGRPVEPRNLFRSFERITAEESLPKIRVRDTRHGCATLLSAAGVSPRDLMAILGLSQIAVTMEIHTHVVQEQQREAMSHMDRLLKRRRKSG